MSGFHVYNITKEEHMGPNSFYCGRGSILGNPFTHIKDKETKAKYVVADREEAISRYASYFDVMYGSNKDFTDAVDEIYGKYKSGNDVYLGCYCYPQSCHCDVIANKLRSRLIREKISGKRPRKTDDI
jgi:hypothetical protein